MRKPYRRRNGVIVDFDPRNNFSDGYNAGRRWSRQHLIFWFTLGMMLGGSVVSAAFFGGFSG